MSQPLLLDSYKGDVQDAKDAKALLNSIPATIGLIQDNHMMMIVKFFLSRPHLIAFLKFRDPNLSNEIVNCLKSYENGITNLNSTQINTINRLNNQIKSGASPLYSGTSNSFNSHTLQYTKFTGSGLSIWISDLLDLFILKYSSMINSRTNYKIAAASTVGVVLMIILAIKMARK